MRSALEPVAAILASDGYRLEITETDTCVVLHVVAGPSACAECLVPKPAFRSIVEHYLTQSRVSRGFEVIYPSDLKPTAEPVGGSRDPNTGACRDV
jgi:hypothetical protein